MRVKDGESMRIGDLAARTRVPARMIRYYEEQGLLAPRRTDNNYRSYDESDVERVLRIRNHVAAGVSTKLVSVIFDMESDNWSEDCDQAFVDMLRDELEGLDERIACLSASRRTLAAFLSEAEVKTAPRSAPAP